MKKNLLLLLVVGSIGQVFASDAPLSPAASASAVAVGAALVELAHPASPELDAADQLRKLELGSSSVQASEVVAEPAEDDALEDVVDADGVTPVPAKDEELRV